MERLRIHVDFAMPEDVFRLLREGTVGHELMTPQKPAASVLSKTEADPAFKNAQVSLGQPDPGLISEAANLRWIHISTSSITRYDTPEFRTTVTKRGIPVTNSASVYSDACAVHALSFMLAEARNLPQGLASRAPNGGPDWLRLRAASRTLAGESVLIVGYGAIGRRLAELLAPLGMRVAAYRRTPRGDENVPLVGAGGLPAALKAADHVVNILPDSAETRHFFNSERIAGIKPGAVFYNIGRGATVNQDALEQALRSGNLAAAWLDVTDPEPLPEGHPLRKLPNCHITPHVAGGHEGEAKTLVRHFLANLSRFLNGEPLLDRVM